MLQRPFLFVIALALLLGLAACDTGISGTAMDNQLPETELSVRDSSLVDNLAGADRLSSTVFASWSGTDPDGFVASYELRFYPENQPPPGPDADWITTASSDSLILLPIPRGERVADVVFEVRAIDNEGAIDATPARTVFPIQNSPPSIRFSQFDLPPDTTFSIVSFAWEASDPEGAENLSRIEVSLNDSLNYVALPPDVSFLTLVGQDIDEDVVEAEVFTGRAFQTSMLAVPGLRYDAENTLYLRAVDQTDTTSALQRFSWYVKRPDGDVLYVNDYRKATGDQLQRYHVDVLRDYLPAGAEIDVWDISTPFGTGTTGSVPRSDLLPPNAQPTLQRQLALYRYIYWVTTASTNNVASNNLPFAAGSMDLFFENGGKLMVHTPITLPTDVQENTGNPAILLLPLSDLISFPDTLREQLRLPRGSAVTPVQSLPGVTESLPALETDEFLINTLPYVADGANIVPLYEASYQYLTRSGNRRGDWTGPSTIASISGDQRIGLFSLPLINEQTGDPILVDPDDGTDAGREATQLILESLGFPR